MPTFDTLAPTYDADFSERPTARFLRGQVHQRLQPYLDSGAKVLEIGCGTGIDAAFMAESGAHITATDVSEKMLAITQTKLGSRGEVKNLDINALSHHDFLGRYTLALANFGALNACQDFSALAQWLSERVVTDGVVCMAVMSRFCLWESAWNFLRLYPKRAMRRWRGQATFTPPEGQPMTVFYPSIKSIEQVFAPWFTVKTRRGLGTALPPSEMFGVIEKRPWLAAKLTRLEGFLWSRAWGSGLADHVWWEMVRRA